MSGNGGNSQSRSGGGTGCSRSGDDSGSGGGRFGCSGSYGGNCCGGGGRTGISIDSGNVVLLVLEVALAEAVSLDRCQSTNWIQ